MSNVQHLLVAAAYAVLTALVCLTEWYRTRRTGLDAVSIFVALFTLQCCIAGIAIFGLLPFASVDSGTGVTVFDRVLWGADVTIALLVCCLTLWFILFFYLGVAISRAAIPALSRQSAQVAVAVLGVRKAYLFGLLAAGMLLTLYSFFQLGDDFVSRYAKLILLRNLDGDVERNAINANALALAQTWNWLSVIAIVCVFEQRRWRWLLPIACVGLIIFAVLGVSRRAMFIPVLMLFLSAALYRGGWPLRGIAFTTVPLVLVVAFGKNLLAAISSSAAVDAVVSDDSWTGALLRAAADIGITIIESLGTLQFMDIGLRFGQDHLISMLQILPEQSLGFDFDYPERIVRLSTEAMDGPDALDIPPGLIGQMWLDFRMLGPVIWGLAFGLQMGVVQSFFENTGRTRQAAAFFVVIIFVIALPLNSGSYDFTFSIDIVVLVLALLLCVRSKRFQMEARVSAMAKSY